MLFLVFLVFFMSSKYPYNVSQETIDVYNSLDNNEKQIVNSSFSYKGTSTQSDGGRLIEKRFSDESNYSRFVNAVRRNKIV